MVTVTLKPYPMMDEPEIAALRALLEERKPRRVLEWGAGGSTLYWPSMFPEIDWWSVEHNPAYAQALKGKTPPNVTLLQLAYPAYHELKPADVGGLFDLIIVDGRQRVRCLDIARDLLNPGGAAVLHDAGRERYTPARLLYQVVTVLHPPKKTKDPRGLWLLTGPRPRGEIMADRGVIYMCWGDPATREAEASMKSLWKHAAELSVMVVGDQAAVQHFKGRPRVLTHLCTVDPFANQTMTGFMAGRIKPLLASISPFERTLYVDAETEFKISPVIGFNLLDRWDFVIAEAELRSLATTFPTSHHEADKTAAWLKTPHILYHNSGMFFWRKSDAALKLFELWSEEWLKYKGWDEQVALLRALLRSDALFLNVPFTWNCRGPKGAFMLYHRFASRAARKYKGRAYTSRNTGPMGIPGRPLVQVQLGPGRFVKCHAGDEEKVQAYFKRMMTSRKVKAA
jgi:hypothetical protein